MELKDDGAGKKLRGLFPEREMQEFGPKDVQMEVAPPSGAITAGEKPRKKGDLWISGMMPRWENITGKSRM